MSYTLEYAKEKTVKDEEVVQDGKEMNFYGLARHCRDRRLGEDYVI